MVEKVMTFYLIWPFSRNNRSVKFWSAFLMDLEKQLVANINVLNENIPDYDILKFKGFLMHKIPFLSSCMKRYQQKT